MTVDDLQTGDKSISAGGAVYVDVSCTFHGGETVVDTQMVIGDGGIAIEEPVLSDDVGFQRNCQDCRVQAALTVEHINAVQTHDDSAFVTYGKAERYGKAAE